MPQGHTFSLVKSTAKNCSHLGARDFRMILCKRNAGNSLHIGKFRLRESAEKNCSEAGPDRFCPARVTLCAACLAPLAEYVRRIRFIVARQARSSRTLLLALEGNTWLIGGFPRQV